MSNLEIREFNNQTIRIREDRYVCLTDMAKASGKNYGHWNSNQSTKSYLETLSGSVGIPIDQLIEVNESKGSNDERGTWGHPKVAIRFAQWCSDAFAVQVDMWVDELMTTGKVELEKPEPKSTADMLLMFAQAFKEHEQRISAIELENIKLKAELKEHDDRIVATEELVDANSDELTRFKNGHGYWYSVVGYANKNNLQGYSLKEAAVIGRRATALCKKSGITPEKINDPRFGKVNVYPEHILDELLIN